MEETQTETPEVQTTPGTDFVAESPAASQPQETQVRQPDFSPLHDSPSGNNPAPVGRFYDVDVTVWAELGRVTLPLGQLVRLAEGSVIELGRPVSEPIDLMAQGVRVARGEVVFVDDCFALRIKEIEAPAEAR